MALETKERKQRSIERLFLLLVSIILMLLFLNLYGVLQKDFATVPQRLQNGTTVNLNAPNAAANLNALLQNGFYFEDPRDTRFIFSVLNDRLKTANGALDNIGDLNKQAFFVDAKHAYAAGGDAFKKRVRLSRSLLGFTGVDSLRFAQETTAPPVLPATVDAGVAASRISGRITDTSGESVSGVLVRLNLLLPQDIVYRNAVSDVAQQTTERNAAIVKTFGADSLGRKQLQGLVAYARTDHEGRFQFQNLPDHKAFEVLPLQPNFQFGPSKGTPDLDGNATFSFTQRPHTLRLFATRDFNNLKREKALIVRTPQEFNQWFWIITAGFFLSFFLVHLFLSWRLPQTDGVLLPVIMLLTGLSFITLFRLQDPLSDRFLAKSMFSYFVAGMFGLVLLQLFDLRRFTTHTRLYQLFLQGRERLTANGLQWAGAAALLLLLTILFGSGPEGSGVKVNLLGFQPSEVVKFLTVLFLAGFFATNEKFISEYARWQKRWTFFKTALIALLGTVFLFLILGDLGPAIVCCFTFIVLFSFSRGDFQDMAGAVLLYILLVWGFENVWLATGVMALVFAAYCLFVKKQLRESALMALVVIAAFLLLDQIPFLKALFPGPVSRLIDRKAIWQDAWNNEVFGGDHVANSIWAMASGGVTGQGMGNSFAKTIPEAHTDMILPSMSENFGVVVIVSVCLLFLVYLHRAILIGRQTGTPFLFYLCAGIGVSTFIQFLLIAGGSTGALPLSGVSLPLVSYGGSSLICNLLAAGVLLSVSNVKGSAVQLRYLTEQQDKNLMPALLASSLGLLLLIVNVSRYAVNGKKWVVQPALVADRSGARLFSYNPRIAILMNRLQAGALYDRNHQLLATSNPQLLQQQKDSLLAAGLESYKLDVLEHKRLERYYPFGEHLFFWTGDANTGVFSGGNNGYFAEYQHNAELRGFRTQESAVTTTATRFRENPFLPQTEREMSLAKVDYTTLAPLLLAGINSKQVDSVRAQNRDVQLSLDARLQTDLQKAMQNDAALAGKRVSIVVMEDSTGDVLVSATYPLPPVTDWEQLTTTPQNNNAFLTTTDLGFTYATQPGSTAKLATALAAFNKLGIGAAQKTFQVRLEDRIRVRSDEPDETGAINLERALVKSNNVYFIKLANEANLEEDMVTLYQQTGMFLHGVGGYFYKQDTTQVFLQERWRNLWRRTEFRSKERYDPENIRATRGLGISGMAWGQGELVATPAAVARLASGIANNGVLVPNRYVLKVSDSLVPVKNGIAVARDTQYAQLLTSYMNEQSAGRVADLHLRVAGKTGTPERIVKGDRINDGWYVFFAPKPSGSGHVVTCIRIEACRGSSEAVKLAGRTVIPALVQLGYIKSFDAALTPKKTP